MKNILTFILVMSSTFGFASELVPLREFDVYASTSQLAKLVRTDACTRVAIIAIKHEILNSVAAENGVDLPEEIYVSAVKKLNSSDYRVTYQNNDDVTTSRTVRTTRSAGGSCKYISISAR